jgi:hypothetical protein
VARTGGFVVRVFSVTTIAGVPHSDNEYAGLSADEPVS